MKKKPSQTDKWVHKLTAPTFMKFAPKRDFQHPDQNTKKGVLATVSDFFTRMLGTIPSGRQAQNGDKAASPQEGPDKGKGENRLRFVRSLTADDVLLGNEDQLDAIQISCIIDGFVDTEFLWSLAVGAAVIGVEVDPRKGYIILLTTNELKVFQYRSKAIREPPVSLASIKIAQQVRFLQVLKEGSVVLCFPKRAEVYSVEENLRALRLRATKQFKLGEGGRLKLFQVPPPVENILNIFFQEALPSGFALWNLELGFFPQQIKMGGMGKIYEFATEARESLLLQNYSREVYFINTGEQLYAIKKGYRVDSARVDKHTQDSRLKFFPPNSLLHVSAGKMELYRLALTPTTPAKIVLSSVDSLQVPSAGDSYEYLQSLQLSGDDFALFYQSRPGHNLRLKGQIRYCFFVSHLVKFQEKIQAVLPQAVRSLDQGKIEQRADMAEKMGLQRKNIYLRLWNNSGKSELEDYKLLLDTLDYDTIRQEIQKKLKKNSMNYRQVLLIQQGCQGMLANWVFGDSCTATHLKNYMISHLLARKLKFYRLIAEIQRRDRIATDSNSEEQGKLLINIQNYNHYKTLDIRGMLLQLVGQLCNEDKDTTLKIRTLLRHFKFPLSVIYLDLLSELVTATKKKFIKLLQAVPELLPCDGHPEGVWSAAQEEQWQHALYADTVVTIQNKQCVQQFCESVWFRRYWLTLHDYVHLTRAQIEALHARNASDAPFMTLLQKVFEIVKEQTALRGIVDLLQDSYPRLPNHLLGKIFLYHHLHQHLRAAQPPSLPEEERIDGLGDFLRWRDPQVFRAMFAAQKLRKGFILKEMKELFAKHSGKETFREGLLNYFASPLSEISDIKYLLNRMNNQKRQFHEQNEGLYQVLVRGMQLKLTLGSPDDVPAGEVLIYIQNIPLPQHNPVFRDLQTLRAINRQAERFRTMKLNMSIFAITKNMEEVLAAVVAYRVIVGEVYKVTDFSALKEMSYVIVEDVIALKQSLYQNSEDNRMVGFIYLAKLCEYQNLLPFIGKLLNDEWFRNLGLNESHIQGVVLFVYKWKMTKDPAFQESASYLQKIVQLLPSENPCRRYIEAQLGIALMLGDPSSPIKYPLNNGQQFFTIFQLQNLISKMPSKQLLQLDCEKMSHLQELVTRVQALSTEGNAPELFLSKIYEMVVVRMLECGQLVPALPKVRQLVELCPRSRNNFVYPCWIIAKIAPELVEQNRNVLLDCASHLVGRPMALIDLLEQLVKMAATTTEQRKFLNSALQMAKQEYSNNFNPENPILQRLYLSLAQNEKERENLRSILKNWHRQAVHLKEQFNNLHFSLAFLILCHDPYVLPSYLFSIRYELNFRTFRAFVSYLTKQEFFNRGLLVQLTKRAFIILFQSVRNNRNIEDLSQEFRAMPLQHEKSFERVTDFKNKLEKVLAQCIQKMKNKAKAILTETQKKIAKGQIQSPQDKQKRIKNRIKNYHPQNITHEYPFGDSDDNSNKFTPKIRRNLTKQEKYLPDFNPSFQRAILCNKALSTLKPYLSPQSLQQLRSKYQAQVQQRNNIFKNLSIDKEKPTSPQLNDVFRNSIRRSRSRSRSRIREAPPENRQNHSDHSSNFLMVKQPTPTPPPQRDSLLNLRSELRGNEQKLELISIQMPQQSKTTETVLEVLPELPLQGKETDHEIKQQIQVRRGQIQQNKTQKKFTFEKEGEGVTQQKVVQITKKQPISNQQVLQQVNHQQIRMKFLQLGDIVGQEKIINLILEGRLPLTDDTVLDFSILEEYSQHPSFQAFLQELLKTVYQRADLSFAEILLFIKKILQKYPKIRVNRNFLQIYDRAQKLQTKFNLDLPLHSIMGLQGLTLQGETNDSLFRYLLPRIVGQLDEEQLIKACKVITLSFKKSDLQQEIMLHYLMSLLQRYSREALNSSRQREMLKEKIEVVMAKIPVRLLGKKEEEILGGVDRGKREEVAQMMVSSCRGRYDNKVADHIQEKYLKKNK